MAKKSAKGRASTPLPADDEVIHRSGRGRARIWDALEAPTDAVHKVPRPATKLKSSALVDTRVIYCGDNLEQLQKLPDACVDLVYIDPPFNSNRNYEVFWGETKEKRAFDDRHANTQADAFFRRTGKIISLLTVKDILEEQLARRLA